MINRGTDLRLCKNCNEKYTPRNKSSSPCYSCGNIRRLIVYNQPTNLVLCHMCYDHIIRKEKHKLENRLYAKKRIRYKGKQIYCHSEQRIGVCNWCRAVYPFDTSKTDMHHDGDRYDDTNPQRFIIELCISCHNKTRGKNWC